ncbi:uncharacterized protein FIESC28_03952 [Fusarium coffeatum]|uniref:Nuclear GTPase SLIP-GC n=1 Tax=Fusarium coffeatum TaxID=231269 RepID=A0A366S3G3_9HYPO|nr:uncharacterized protein FIESC28_03952 [Fusarium coffeatum]RBR23210.1 hypothetical protein FIESC28_03952 [Fusarium coffeatum]
MEAGGRALPKPIKREASPGFDAGTDSAISKRQCDEASGIVHPQIQFPWQTCRDLDDVERLKIKEKAVRQARKNCLRISRLLKGTMEQLKQRQDAKYSVMMGENIIKQWCNDYGEYYSEYLMLLETLTNIRKDKLCKSKNKLEILVGVEGPTGAGKSSFLGCLLGIPELFPAGQEAASTAVVGKVSWNYSSNCHDKFRATIVFRKKAEVENDLVSLLLEINRSAALEDSDFGEEDDSIEGLIAAKIESKERIDYELPKVKAVWGLDKHGVVELAQQHSDERTYSEIVASILETNPDALQYLDAGEEMVSSGTAIELANIIKPFLDSTSQSNGDGNRWSTWPLVKEVQIYAKADILKSGITLVDLPGCGDAVASRSDIAQKFARRLDVRMVVSPIIRMADEKQAQTLMQNGFEQAQMRISGKLDGNGFAVVGSKIDDLKVDTYINDCMDLRDDVELRKSQTRLHALIKKQADLKSKQSLLKETSKKAKSAERGAAKQLASTLRKPAFSHKLKELEAKRDKTAMDSDEADKALEQNENRLERATQEILYLKHFIHHRAISTRNRRVMSNIRTSLARNLEDKDDRKKPVQSQGELDFFLPIFPVSTRAFWELEDSQKAMDGFPTPKFTGVPAVKQWLHRATMSKREKHLDESLDGYQSLITMMRTYSQPTGHDGEFTFTRQDVEHALAATHETFEHRLGQTLAAASYRIDKLNPLKKKDKAMKRFIAEAETIVSKWGKKFPDDADNDAKITWNTYGANISRKGTAWTTKGNPPIRYSWMENLASPVVESISKDWDAQMNKELPKLKSLMMAYFSLTWTQYLDQLHEVLRSKVPSLGHRFSIIRPNLDRSQRATETKILGTLNDLSQKTSNVVFDAVNYLNQEMRSTFQAALTITGKKSFANRKHLILSKVQNDVQPMCKEMIKRLEDGLAERKAVVPDQLRKIAGEAIAGVQRQLSFLVNNLVENSRHDLEMRAKKSEVQKTIRDMIAKWENDWTEKGNLGSHILDEDLSIPDMIPKPDFEYSDVEEDEEEQLEEDTMSVDEDEIDDISVEDDDPNDKDFICGR